MPTANPIGPAPSTDAELVLAFRATRDPAAFAELFERHAYALWRHASRAGLDADADDLVQACFLSLIEGVDAVDVRRPLRPWLVGILTKHMAMRRRSERQRRLDFARLDVRRRAREAASATDVVVGANEIADKLDGAVRRLPQPYRDVVLARFLGAEPTHAIAARLGREAGTVRKQITRGLQLLRRALPVEVAVVALAFILPRRAIAAASASCARRPALALFAAVFAVCIGMVAWRASETTSAALATLVVDDGTPQERAMQGDVVATTQDVDARGAASAQPSAASHVATRRSIVVRFVDGRAAARFPLRLLPLRDTLAASQLDPSARDVVTDADGRLNIDALVEDAILMPAGGLPRLYLRASADEANASTQFCLGPERVVRGRVVDEDGVPQSNATLVVSATMGRGDAGGACAPSSVDGTFTARIGCEQPYLWARAVDGRLSPPQFVPLVAAGAGEAAVDMRFVLPRAAQPLRGRVVDESGAAVAAALVAWFPRADARHAVAPAYGLCDAEGRFDLGRVRATEGVLIARHDQHATSWRQIDDVGDDGEYSLRLARGMHLSGVVRDPLGQPLPFAVVQSFPAPLGPDQQDGGLRSRDAKADALGRYEITGLGVGEVCVFTMLAARGYRAKRFVEVPQTSVCDLDCEATGFVTGVALDAEGRPLAGHRVDGIPGEGCDPLLRARLLTTCTTKSDGSFTLQLPRRVPYRLGLFEATRGVEDAANQPLAVLDQAKASEHVTLKALAHERATLRGRVEVLEDAERSVLRLQNSSWSVPRDLALADDGSFVVEGLVAGSYALVLEHPRFGRRVVADVDARCGGEHDIGYVPFALPGALVIEVPGAKAASAVLRDARGTFVQRRLARKDGGIRFVNLAPGNYSVVVASSQHEPLRRECLVTSARVTKLQVAASKATPCSIAVDYDPVGMPFFPRAPLHVRVLDDRGAEVFEDFVFADDDHIARSSCGLRAGRYRVEATGLGGRSVKREIEVEREACAVAVSLR